MHYYPVLEEKMFLGLLIKLLLLLAAIRQTAAKWNIKVENVRKIQQILTEWTEALIMQPNACWVSCMYTCTGEKIKKNRGMSEFGILIGWCVRPRARGYVCARVYEVRERESG